MTMAMSLELAPVIRVNAISPGYVLTPMQRAEYTDQMLDAVNKKIPIGDTPNPRKSPRYSVPRLRGRRVCHRTGLCHGRCGNNRGPMQPMGTHVTCQGAGRGTLVPWTDMERVGI